MVGVCVLSCTELEALEGEVLSCTELEDGVVLACTEAGSPRGVGASLY